MTGQLLRLIGAVILGAVVFSSLAITRYLSLLEGGIRRDIDAVDRIVAVEREIQKQNDILTDMVTTTKRIGTGIDGVLETSSQIASAVTAVGAANRETLTLNGKLETENGAAARELTRVVAALRSMNRSAQEIDQFLGSLGETVDGEMDALQAIAANTARMNLKTTGVPMP